VAFTTSASLEQTRTKFDKNIWTFSLDRHQSQSGSNNLLKERQGEREREREREGERERERERE
jgi:hypothetical protein